MTKINVRYNYTKDDIAFAYNGLLAYNELFIHEQDVERLALLYRNSHLETCAGAIAMLQYTSCYLQILWVAESARKLGVGTELLKTLENESRAQGITDIFLDTYSFQAPDFYSARGFVEVGRLRNYPKNGVDKIFFRKKLG